MIAACVTLRAGAVERLTEHQFKLQLADKNQGRQMVQLYV